MDKSAVLDVQIVQQVLVEHHGQVIVLCRSFPEKTRHMSTNVEVLLISAGHHVETEGASSPLLPLYPDRQVVTNFHGQNIFVIQFI